MHLYLGGKRRYVITPSANPNSLQQTSSISAASSSLRVTNRSFYSQSEILEQKPWHNPDFMSGCPPEVVEQWLVALLKSQEEANGSPHRNSGLTGAGSSQSFAERGVQSSQVDALAYLRVLQSYANSKIGGAPQKCEYWIGRLERHYNEVVKDYLGICEKNIEDAGESSGVSGPSVVLPPRDDTTECSANVEFEQDKSPFAKFLSGKSQLHGSSNDKQSSLKNNDQSSALKDTQERGLALVKALQPTVQHYNTIIMAWSNSTEKISIVRSRRWLTKLEEFDNESVFGIEHPSYYSLKPNAESYDLYLHSCSRGLGKNMKLLKERAEECEDLLRYRLSNEASDDIRPTTDSFNYVLRAWTRCRKEPIVGDRVMALVREMEGIQRDALQNQTSSSEEWKRAIVPNTKTYTIAMDAWIVVAGIKSERWHSEQMELNNTYGQLASSRTRKTMEDHGKFMERRNKYPNGEEEMENAAALLKYIQTLEDCGRADVHTTVIGYNTLLSGWAKLANTMRPDVPLKSEGILRDMMVECENGDGRSAPDVLSFNAVIKAWSKTKRPNSASRCEWWLRKMIKESSTADENRETPSVPAPNVQTYNLVMEAWLQLGDPARVQDLLLEMDASTTVSPNSESFSKVIRAWLHDEMNSTHQYGLSGRSCENAWKWLKELIEREKRGTADLGPAPELFSSILKTAARSESKGENLLTVGQNTFWVRHFLYNENIYVV